MKRYHESTTPGELLGEPVYDYLLLGTLGYALLLGVGMVAAGRWLRRPWMILWGGGLALVSAASLVVDLSGWS